MSGNKIGELSDIPCRMCEASFKSPNDLDQHQMSCHSIQEISEALTKLIIRCLNSGFYFESSESEMAELYANDEASDIENKEEEQVEAEQIKTVQRKNNAKTKPKCDICSKEFASRGNLNKHKVIHSQKKPFQCDECKQSFNSKRDLKSHTMQKHTGERPFVCKFCGKGFVHKFYLNEHLDYHSGIKNFQCYKCGKKFTSSSALTKHISRHKTNREFKCELCTKEFVVVCDLKAHVKFVHEKVSRGIPVFNTNLTLSGGKIPPNYEPVNSDEMKSKSHTPGYSIPKPVLRAVKEDSTLKDTDSQSQVEEWMISQGLSIDIQGSNMIRVPSVANSSESLENNKKIDKETAQIQK